MGDVVGQISLEVNRDDRMGWPGPDCWFELSGISLELL